MVLMGANAVADANHTLTMEGRLTYSGLLKYLINFSFKTLSRLFWGAFTKFRHYKKLQQATKRQMWRRGRFLELSRLLNQREGARGVMTIGNAHASLVLPRPLS